MVGSYVYRTIFALGRIMAKRIPGFRPVAMVVWRVAMVSWRPIGSFKFRVAYRDACRRGNVCLHVGAGSVRLDG